MSQAVKGVGAAHRVARRRRRGRLFAFALALALASALLASPAALATGNPTSVSVSCGSGVVVGQPATCTATVTDKGGAPTTPTGAVTFASDSTGTFTPSSKECALAPVSESEAGCSIEYTPTEVGSGKHKITASYAGDVTHEPSSKSVALNVGKRATTTAVGCGLEGTLSAPATCTVTVADNGAGAPSMPSGTVTFETASTGTFTPSSKECTLAPVVGHESEASCSIEYTPGTTGEHKITASYGGDATHETSSNSVVLNVGKRSTTMSVSCGAGVVLGQVATCTVTASDGAPGTRSQPAGVVSFASAGEGTFTPASRECTLKPLAGHEAEASCSVEYAPSAVGSGSHVITAAFGGDETHQGISEHASLAVSAPAGQPAPPPPTTTTTTTTPPPSPPPPGVPKCRLKAREQARTVASGHTRARETPVLIVTFACDQTARVKITGTLAIAASGHGRTKKKARTLKLETASAQALVGKPQPAVTMVLPTAAAKALAARARTLATITFTVANEHGAGIATLKLMLVPLVQLKKIH